MAEGEPPERQREDIRVEASAQLGIRATGRVTVKYGLPRLRAEMRRVDERLDEPVEAFLIGGCAMTYAELKPATKDIDLVLRDAAALAPLERAMHDLGYTTTTKVDPAYEDLGAARYFDKPGAPRWDVHFRKVCRKLELSPGMVARAVREEPGFERLLIQRVAPSDIFIFKSITERPDDKFDMDQIYARGLDWGVVLEEMRWQCARSDVAWSVAFLDTMEELAGEDKVVPILDALRELAEREVGELAVLSRVREGAATREAVAKAMGEDAAWVAGLIDGLIAEGRLVERDGNLQTP